MTDYRALDLAVRELGCSCEKDVPMSRHTTFKIGGNADRLITVFSLPQLQKLLSLFKSEAIPWMILGRGSNLLVSDKGIRGAVLLPDGDFKSISLSDDGLTVTAGAGASLASLCSYARGKSLSGVEFAWGIPGSVGGAVYMNAGAYGGEIKDVVLSVTHITPDGRLVTLSNSELGLSYRKSFYSGGKNVILFASFKLLHGDEAAVSSKMEELMARRKEKQPYDMPSAGSVFKRPQNGYAAALIEQCGLKGRRVGGAEVSVKHSGFIVNTGGATCKDVLELMDIVKKEVYANTGIMLEPEIRVTGEM